MISPRFIAASLGLLAVSAALAGCGGKTIDPKSIETQLQSRQQDVVKGLAVNGAHCPSGEDDKVGKTFTCTIKVAGVQVNYTVKITKAGSRPQFTLEPTEPIINAKVPEDQLASQAGSGWTIDCGPPIQQVPVGSIITCHATNGSDTQTVQYKVTDTSGTLNPVTSGDTTTTVGGGASTDTTPGGADSQQ
jgi:hypothetical protein